MKIILMTALVFFSLAAGSAGINSGADLLKSCKLTQAALKKTSSGANPINEILELKKAGECVHFLMGFDSGQAVVSRVNKVPGTHCQPKSSSVGEMVNAVVLYLEQNDKFHNAPSGIAAWQALSDYWPCSQ